MKRLSGRTPHEKVAKLKHNVKIKTTDSIEVLKFSQK